MRFYKLLALCAALALLSHGSSAVAQSNSEAALTDVMTDVLEASDSAWRTDSDLAPGAIAAWDRDEGGKVTHRLTMIPFPHEQLVPEMLEGMETQIPGSEKVGEHFFFDSPTVRDLRFLFRVRPGEPPGAFWYRAVKVDNREFALMATLRLEDAGELSLDEVGVLVDERQRAFFPAFDLVTSFAFAKRLKQKSRGGNWTLDLDGEEQELLFPAKWSVEPKGASLQAWSKEEASISLTLQPVGSQKIADFAAWRSGVELKKPKRATPFSHFSWEEGEGEELVETSLYLAELGDWYLCVEVTYEEKDSRLSRSLEGDIKRVLPK